MKILWVKADKLLPVNNGGNIRTYHVLRFLSSRHELTFFSYYGGEVDRGYDRELQQQLPGAVAVCTGDREHSGFTRGLDYLSRLGDAAPYAVSRFSHSIVKRQLADYFNGRKFDVTVCDFLDAAVNFPERLDIPSVLFQHNVESEIWRRHAETAANPVRKAICGMEYRKMRRYEQSAVQKFQHVIAVSENDRALMAHWVAPEHITVVPTGVDLAQYSPDTDESGTAPLVTFVGAMDWEPNVDGMEYFCGEIWPLVLAEVPEARFRIVGRNPGRRVQRWASETVEITGQVPSVVEHLRQSAVVVVPLRIGGGTRLKIYEAMATAKSVVSTTVGAEGLDVEHGQDIILADDVRTFSQAIIMLLRDSDLRRRYGRAAAETASRFDWPAIGLRFSEVLRLVAGTGSSVEARSTPTVIPAASA
jgi:polysaccharide biosynthesis protein PslH